MKKADLILLARNRLAGEARTKGEKAFLSFFIEYLRRLDIAHDEKYDFYQLDSYLPQIVGDAFEEFRTSEADWVVSYRKKFEREVEHRVPNLTDIGDSDSIHRALEINTLGYLFRDITGCDRVKHQIEAYLNAEMATLQLYVDKFLRLVYRNGLYNLVKDVGGGMSGRFGEVDLRCFITAGRVMFTFARQVGDSEIDVTFIAEDGDPNAYSAGVQSVCATLPECIAMINEVIDNWPTDGDEQARLFTRNESVTVDVLAAMKQAS